jgi:hypothetical protein
MAKEQDEGDDAEKDLELVTEEQMALKKILKTNPRLYCDRFGQPRIVIRVGDKERPYSIRDSAVQAWMAFLLWDTAEISLHRQQLTWITTVLEGMAATMPFEAVSEPDAWLQASQEPVIEVVMAYLERPSARKKYDGLVSKLLTELNEGAEIISADYHSKNWPRSAAQLGYRLRHIQHLLPPIGIQISFRRTNAGSTVKLELIESDGAPPTPTLQPAPRNPNTPNALVASGGSAGDAPGIQGNLVVVRLETIPHQP